MYRQTGYRSGASMLANTARPLSPAPQLGYEEGRSGGKTKSLPQEASSAVGAKYMAKIYLVDDDENILTSVSMFLEDQGYEVRKFHDGVTALEALKKSPPDLAVFDVKVIFLTSKDDEFDEAIGLNMGADDYIKKPFSQRLLGERIKAVLRRAQLTNIEQPLPQEGDEKVIQRGKLVLDPNRHACSWDGHIVRLTVTEFLILESLAKRPGYVKSRDQLMDAAYEDQVYVDDRTIDSHIKGARRPAMFSRLARFIFLSNIVGLLILVCGAMTLQRFSQGLIEAKIENLSSQAALITTIMGDTATGIGLAAELDVQNARDVLSRVNLPDRWRVRLHDKSGTLIADSTQYETDIAITELAPIVSEIPEPTWQEVWQARIEAGVEKSLHNLPWRVHRRERLRQNLTVDIRKSNRFWGL